VDHGLTIACEGVSDEPVLRKLAEVTGFRVDRVFGQGGKDGLDKSLAAFSRAANYSRWPVP
jgi:hypothetical protein